MGTTTVELGDGESAVLRDPKTLTNGQRKPILVASQRHRDSVIDPRMIRELQASVIEKDTKRQKELVAALELGVNKESTGKVGEAAIVALVESWTLELPLPSEQPLLDDDGVMIGSEVLDEIQGYDYDRLQEAVSPLVPLVRWTPESPGPKAPRAPSSARSRKR